MKVLLIICAVFLTGAYGGVINNQEKCNVVLFGVCTDMFARALGLPDGLPKDFKVMNDQVKKLIGQGAKKQVCDAIYGRIQCLGGETPDCMTVDFLTSYGIPESDAKAYIDNGDKTLTYCNSLTLFTSNAKCELDRFTKCSTTFVQALGLPQLPTDPKVVDDQIKKLLAEGKKKQVCDAAGALQNCLGDEADDCVSVDFLKSIGVSDADAKIIVQGVEDTLKLCSSPAIFKSNAKCEVDRFSKCADTFAKLLGFPSLPSDPKVIDAKIKQLLADGKKKQVCDASVGLQRCLGDQADDCMTVDFLKSIGYSEADAKDIIEGAKQTLALCL